eukprot:CAMPEP_0194252444 /NCGR_PEP_ID=MMETSP0158-20130606/27633_1 /TAXON_ID=33649 /ORGANISM="Thalassionema nitzschioides, Strain L26-B" /LENGTH=383 /DNA_ID=CAMNT_0038989861 /DNA_START=20 /DNA_END=1168 /DNA_ORIENTATION=-
MTTDISATTAAYCFLDLDINNHRSKLATCAAFVDATDSRYGFSSKDLRLLGGSEVSRIPDLIASDHEWGSKLPIECKPPIAGNRLIVKLFWDIAPLACANFATLCANGSSVFGKTAKIKPAPIGESGKPLTYRNSIVHRIVPGFICQGGDFVFGNGSGGESIYNGKKFKDERNGLQLKHDHKGVLSMGNSGKNSNSSQFFLTFDAAPQCDGKHVVFGQLLSGDEILDYIETVGSKDGTPTVPVTITDCGLYHPFETPSSGYWYDQPDADCYSGMSPIFIVKPRVGIIAPSTAAMERFQKALGTTCIMVSSMTPEEQNSDGMIDTIVEWLENFKVDVILVASASKHYIPKDFALPPSWQSYNLDEVVMESKPVASLKKIRAQSW